MRALLPCWAPAAAALAGHQRDRAGTGFSGRARSSRAATLWRNIAGGESGAHVPLYQLPYFLPDDWSKGIENETPQKLDRPYIAAAGRLVKMKGFQRLIPLLRYLPEVDLLVAGTGPYESDLKELARGHSNVRFEGLLGGAALARLFRSARAVVVPSLFPETFGYVVLESFAVGTPVVVNQDGGALYETGFLSGGGLAYRTDTELLTAIRRMVHDHRLHDDLAARGFGARMGPWSEAEHLERYFDLVAAARASREQSKYPRPHVLTRRCASKTV